MTVEWWRKLFYYNPSSYPQILKLIPWPCHGPLLFLWTDIQKSAIYPKSEWRELVLSFPHTYRTYLSIGNGKKTHTQSLLHVGNRKIHFLPPHDPPTSVAEARCQIWAPFALRCDYYVREMSCHPQNSLEARSHFLFRFDYSIARPSLDWSVKIWLKQTQQCRCCESCYEKETPPGH